MLATAAATANVRSESMRSHPTSGAPHEQKPSAKANSSSSTGSAKMMHHLRAQSVSSTFRAEANLSMCPPGRMASWTVARCSSGTMCASTRAPVSCSRSSGGSSRTALRSSSGFTAFAAAACASLAMPRSSSCGMSWILASCASLAMLRSRGGPEDSSRPSSTSCPCCCCAPPRFCITSRTTSARFCGGRAPMPVMALRTSVSFSSRGAERSAPASWNTGSVSSFTPASCIRPACSNAQLATSVGVFLSMSCTVTPDSLGGTAAPASC
mmetsp:Transcript_57896/g.169247  ORF Transcript_57896/g.169247 Transcript_57896/m.169247 type:complete len:268 (-) Transcript_57896:227-1030(-)